MLGYRIEINGDTSGAATWNVSLGTDDKEKFNDTAIPVIYSIVEKSVAALRDIQAVTPDHL